MSRGNFGSKTPKKEARKAPRVLTLSCALCTFQTPDKQKLKLHLITEHERREILCPRGCGKRYVYARSLQLHLADRCGREPNFCCEFCGYRSHYLGSLNAHVQSVHPKPDSTPAICHRCAKTFPSIHYLGCHLRQNCKRNDLSCELCDYTGKRKYPNLASHMQRMHPQLFPGGFPCPGCRRQFNCIYPLNRHKRSCRKLHNDSSDSSNN